jgi:quercetin dioxygenase-like cupin family protein
MSEPVSRKNAERYEWGQNNQGRFCEGWHLVRGEELSIIEERMTPGSEEQRHFHTRSRQFFYVLAGQLTIELEGICYSLTALEGLEIPPGIPHQVTNLSGEDVRFLVISQFPTHSDRQPA